MTVFVVDDDASVRQSMRRLLTSVGYDVVVCGSAAEFLSLPNRPRPSCLVTDLRMPGKTGLDLQDALRRSGRELPLIVSSGQADAATAARVRAAGALRFLVKPFDVRDLLAAVSEALRLDQDAIPEEA
jgi:two-component system, LuxR family, response regulator FixJ